MSLYLNSDAFTMQKDCYYTPKAMLFEGDTIYTKKTLVMRNSILS